MGTPMRAALCALFSLLAFSTAAIAEPVPAARRTDWSFAGVPGGIPTRSTICSTFSAGATAASINSAIASCPANQVVFLNAGTYTSAALNGVIALTKSDVTLRGAGASQTILTGAQIIRMDAGTNVALGTAITGGATKDSTTFTVASTANLAVGVMIEVDRADDTNIVVNTGTGSGGSRNITQVNMITGISGNTITVRNPFFYDFSTGTPKVKWYYSGITKRSGIENLKLNHTGFTASSSTTNIYYCDSCWMKGIDSAQANSYHFVILGTLNFEVDDSYIHDAAVTGPNNSGLDFFGNYDYGANSNAKVENNIFNRAFPSIELNKSSSGFYVGYNYEYGSGDFGGNTYLVTWTYDNSHDPFQVMNLYEGNIGEMFGADGYYGGAAYGTALRNYFLGYNLNGNVSGNAVQLKRLNYYYNIIGNVLGSNSQNPTVYATGCSTPNIFELGYPNSGNCDTTAFDGFTPTGGYPDPKVLSTLMRWGNYDYFHDATQFVSGEIPSGVSVPSDQVIPDSYYYASRPAWWTSGLAWPPIGPDVTGGTGDTSGHVKKTPSQLCWESSNLLTGGSFNASTCYAANTSPSITSALTATGTVSSAFSYTITATNTPTSYAATGLPAGLSVNTSTGAITGTPTTAATTNVSISATNATGTGTATLVVTINDAGTAPSITSALSVTGLINSAFSYTILATNTPTSFNATGLPTGLSVNTTTGIISGTPTVAGSSSVSLSATNATGTGNATLTIIVQQRRSKGHMRRF